MKLSHALGPLFPSYNTQEKLFVFDSRQRPHPGGAQPWNTFHVEHSWTSLKPRDEAPKALRLSSRQ